MSPQPSIDILDEKQVVHYSYHAGGQHRMLRGATYPVKALFDRVLRFHVDARCWQGTVDATTAKALLAQVQDTGLHLHHEEGYPPYEETQDLLGLGQPDAALPKETVVLPDGAGKRIIFSVGSPGVSARRRGETGGPVPDP